MKEVAGRDQCYLYVDAMRTLFDLDTGEDGDPPAAEGAPGEGPSAQAPAGAGLVSATEPPQAAADPPASGTVHHLRGTGTEDS
jgi:hypothetical protein